jgi:hypothetical protein
MSNVIADLQDEADAIIRQAVRYDITLTWADMDVVDGELYVDGMDPREWLDAVIGVDDMDEDERAEYLATV